MISIVICTLNEENYLPALIKSIYIQNFIDFEVIVVDAGSEDETIKIGEGLEVEKKNLRFINGPRGIAKQRNYGAALAKFERILFLDADVELPADFLFNFSREVNDKNITVGGTRIFALEKKWNFRLMYWAHSYMYLPVVRVFNPVVHGCSIFTTKTLHRQIGGFEESIMFEDYRYGKSASAISRTKILRSTYVYTSARRFMKGGGGQIGELLVGGLLTFISAGLPTYYFKEYNKKTGNHALEE